MKRSVRSPRKLNTSALKDQGSPTISFGLCTVSGSLEDQTDILGAAWHRLPLNSLPFPAG